MLLPLTHPHVNRHAGLAEPANAAGEEEIERRVQELLDEWLGRYFTGVQFETERDGHAPELRTFTECVRLYDTATPPEPIGKPIIHTILADRRDAAPERGRGGYWAHSSQFVWNFLLRTHPQATTGAAVSETARTSAFRTCRRLGDQLRWLLESPHTALLSDKGIVALRVTNGPREVPAGAWFLRQLVVQATILWESPDYESP